MPEKKRQHYVPQFYLRRFSIQSEGRNLGIFNLKSNRFILSGSLKEQAARPYFYGTDLRAETILGGVESTAAPVLGRIVKELTLPARYSTEHLTLVVFTLFQHARTLSVVAEQNELLDKMVKTIYSKDSRVSDELENLKIVSNNPIDLPLRIAARGYILALDLEYKLIVNSTNVPFITSDNPVVFYNQFLERRNWPGGMTGLACKGLQIVFPISPSQVLVLYDPAVYQIGPSSKSTINISDRSDVFALNRLQVLNALQNLYFNHDISEEQIRKLVTTSHRFKRPSMATVNEYPLSSSSGDDERTRSLLHVHRTDVKCKLKLTMIKETAEAKAFKRDNRAVVVRNEELCKVHEQFLGMVRQGKYQKSDFQSFLRDADATVVASS